MKKRSNMLTFDEGLENFEKLLNDSCLQFTGKNEAETRLKIIDRIFRDCLGWELSDISVEENYNGTYTDYVFSTSNKALIVEAKKEGKDGYSCRTGRSGIDL